MAETREPRLRGRELEPALGVLVVQLDGASERLRHDIDPVERLGRMSQRLQVLDLGRILTHARLERRQRLGGAACGQQRCPLDPQAARVGRVDRERLVGKLDRARRIPIRPTSSATCRAMGTARRSSEKARM